MADRTDLEASLAGVGVEAAVFDLRPDRAGDAGVRIACVADPTLSTVTVMRG